jgi:hypothetical protein
MLDEVGLLIGVVQAGDVVGAAELGISVKDRAVKLGACGVTKVTNSLVMAGAGEGDLVEDHLGGLVESVALVGIGELVDVMVLDIRIGPYQAPPVKRKDVAVAVVGDPPAVPGYGEEIVVIRPAVGAFGAVGGGLEAVEAVVGEEIAFLLPVGGGLVGQGGDVAVVEGGAAEAVAFA